MADAPITERAAVYKKSFDSPDETRTSGKGKAEIANIGGASIFRLYYEPGWKWSERIKPMAQTDRCEVRHVGYMVQGRLKVVGRDGSEGELRAGDAFVIPPGPMPGRSGMRPRSCSMSTDE